ncbi:MAG: TSCPD domain-containing protein [Firmicutes bacterium]|nr:TSCPD domain-containing protein [Bacillota bacterium]
MKKHFIRDNEGRTCSKSISFDYEDGVIKNVFFDNGCPGNTVGVARLAEGRAPEELIGLLKGVTCRGESSCPNEFACALEEMLEELKAEEA